MVPPAVPAAYISDDTRTTRGDKIMRAEIEAAVGDIRRSLALLRRHL
jgi:hypothetical protein